MTLVGKVMVRSDAAVEPAATVASAAKLMAERKLGILPVVDHGAIVGVVTDRDITVRAIAPGLDPNKTPVSQIMSRDVSVCTEATPIGSALDKMADEQRRRLPVTSADGKVVGIVSLADAARDYDDKIKVIAVFNKVFDKAGPQTG